MRLLAVNNAPTKLKVNQPRRTVYRNETPESRRISRENKLEYKKDRAKRLREGKLYRKRNKMRLKQREEWLSRAPRKPAKVRTASDCVLAAQMYVRGIGVLRDNMPQIGNADAFCRRLDDNGVRYQRGTCSPTLLLPTQQDIDGSKIADMIGQLQKGDTGILSPIFVSRDGRILDGHHRVYAQIGHCLNTGEPMKTNVIKVMATIEELLDLARLHTNATGAR